MTTAEIRARLTQHGHDVDVRTIQRDLTTLETKFMLMCRTEGRTNHWYWSRKQVPLEIPGISNITAITLLLVKDYLSPLLPRSVLNELNPYMSKAREVLKGTKFERWGSRVRMIQRGPLLAPPTVQAEVRDTIYKSLLEDVQVEVDYRSRGSDEFRKIRINPLGLVVREGVFYLVATFWQYTDIRQLALHRMTNPTIVDERSRKPRTFSLKRYIETEEAFAYPASAKQLNLKVLFDADAAFHLTERPLAEDQRLTQSNDGRILLRARVPNTAELRWWLLGFGDQVEILSPVDLRREFQSTASRMVERYGTH